MSVLDKVVAAVTPEPSDEDRMRARREARSLGSRADWLSMVLDHHEQIEQCFAAVKAAGSASEQRSAQKQLALLLTGHSLAEEMVLYPAMALSDQKGHAGSAFTQQSAAKVQTVALDDLEPMSQDYLDKLEHLRAAVAHHVYEEESEWFPHLVETAGGTKQGQLSMRYREEFERYMKGGDGSMGDGRSSDGLRGSTAAMGTSDSLGGGARNATSGRGMESDRAPSDPAMVR